MRCPLIFFTVRRLMIAVAVVGIVLGLVIHVQFLLKDDKEVAGIILLGEGVAAAILAAIGLGVGFLVRLIHRDHDYAIRLRRNDVPNRVDWLSPSSDLYVP